MPRSHNDARPGGENAAVHEEAERVADALNRFFAYHAALPPDEHVGDFLYLVKPGRLLRAGQVWAQDCASGEDAGAKVIAAIVDASVAAQARRADLVALASYALRKTGGIAQTSAPRVGERLVALLLAHVFALRLVAAAVQNVDRDQIARLMQSLVAAWPAPDVSVGGGIGDAAARPMPVAPTVSAAGGDLLDRLFDSLDAEGVFAREPQALVNALLRSAPPLRRHLFSFLARRRKSLPASVRLKALGYDETTRVGFSADLTVEREARIRKGVVLIRHPDTLFVVTDGAFEQAIARAARLATAADAPQRSGSLFRWSLRRDSAPTDTVFFASGSSIAGAFAVAFRLALERAARFHPDLNWGIVSSLAEDGALRGVDASTLKAKIDAAGLERLVLSVDQASESAYLLRHRRRILTAATLDEAARHCLRSFVPTLLRQYRAGLTVAVLAVALAVMTGTQAVQSILADKRTEFDASAEFSSTTNPPPRSPWRYGWIPVAPVPDPRTFIPLRRCSSSDERPTQPHGLYEWCPPDADSPVVAFSKNAADIPWPAAGVVFPGRAFRIQPDRIGNCACLRFVAPRAGMYQTTATFWGLSVQNYATLLYLFEDNHLVGTYPSSNPSTIWRKDAVSFASKRGQAQTIVHAVHLRQGQTIDLIVGPSLSEEAYRMEHSTGIVCHVRRLN